MESLQPIEHVLGLPDGVRETDGVGDVVRPRSVENRVHFDDELDPGVAGTPHVVRPMEPAARTLESAVEEPCRPYPWAGEAGGGTFGAAPFEPPGPAVDASVRLACPAAASTPRHARKVSAVPLKLMRSKLASKVMALSCMRRRMML